MKAAPPIWLLVLITLSGTLGIHVFMPALPEAARALAVAPGAMQATISVYILGLAVGQPVYGPLSDSFGRRPVLLGGLALFTLGGLWSAWAPTVGILAAGRFVQALGGCAGLVLGRAMVRDTHEVDQAVRRLALINMVVLIGPGLAPLLGQLVLMTTGWRAILLLLTALGAANLLLAARLLPETGTPSGPLKPAALAANYRRMLSSRALLGLAIGGGCATTASYAFFAAAPFIFVEELHRPAHELGLYLGLLILGAATGNAAAGRWASRIGIERLMLGANGVAITSAALMCAATFAGWAGWQFTLGTMLVFCFVAGVVSPLAMTKAMSLDARLVGLAAGLYGSIQMSVGALCTWLAGFGPHRAQSVALVLVAAAVTGQLCFRLALAAPAKA